MEGFDLSTLGNDSGIGINESKCAMVLKEKTALYQGLLDIMDFIVDADGLSDEEFFQVIDDNPAESSKKVAHENKDLLQNTSKTHHNKKAMSAPSGPHQMKKRGKTKQ